MGLPHWVVLAVAAQRLLELVYARLNTRRLLAAGGIETGARHYPLFVLLHGGWLLALFVFTPADAPVYWPLLALFALLQLARAWVVVTLGRYWTTRIITVREAPLIISGPYRFLKHPNYAVVALEIPVLPLAFGEVALAVAFALLNVALLWHRISIENSALRDRPGSIGRL
jgi:methyltransferase